MPQDMWVLASVEVELGNLIRSAQPDNRSPESKCIPSLEVHSGTLEREIRHQELSALDLNQDSITNLFPEVLSVDADGVQAAVSFDRHTNSFFENDIEIWTERHRDETNSRHSTGDGLYGFPAVPS